MTAKKAVTSRPSDVIRGSISAHMAYIHDSCQRREKCADVVRRSSLIMRTQCVRQQSSAPVNPL